MSEVVVWAIIFITAISIYVDATANKIGKIPGKRSIINNSAGLWATGTILLWIVVFPLYLIKRGKLIELAKENPVTANNRTGIIVLMSFIGCAWIALTWIGSTGTATGFELPLCDSADTNNVLSQIINSQPTSVQTGLRYVGVNDVTERAYNTAEAIRVCSGTLVTTGGELPIQFNVIWGDAATGAFKVQIIGL